MKLDSSGCYTYRRSLLYPEVHHGRLTQAISGRPQGQGRPGGELAVDRECQISRSPASRIISVYRRAEATRSTISRWIGAQPISTS
jgi:hypothetical protein